jgi:hypothetical protein
LPSKFCIEPGSDLVNSISENGDIYTGFSMSRFKLPAKKTHEVITTTAKDSPYSNTAIELLFDLYHEKKISANTAIRQIFRP